MSKTAERFPVGSNIGATVQESGICIAVEMIGLMHGEGLACGDAGACAVRTRPRLVPVGSEIEARRAQIIGSGLVTDIVDGDPLIVGEEQDITEAGDLSVQGFHTEARRAQKIVHGLSVCPQPAILDDDRGPHHGGVKLVISDAPHP